MRILLVNLFALISIAVSAQRADYHAETLQNYEVESVEYVQNVEQHSKVKSWIESGWINPIKVMNNIKLECSIITIINSEELLNNDKIDKKIVFNLNYMIRFLL
ncbi:hypothetical protein [Zobellia nedashkovskayae]|uniref:hypothetical protein n=1 Tax=Zobellia nedashkovskayae TaxID=2779510 RepID=UPI001889DB0B|nr:hypothetical protein [Zobellia nedashkovskayae]